MQTARTNGLAAVRQNRVKTIGDVVGTVVGLAYIIAAIALLLWLPERITAYGSRTDNLVDRAVDDADIWRNADILRAVHFSEGRERVGEEYTGATGDLERRQSPRPAGRPYRLAVAEIHRRESRCGQDPKSRPGIVGPKGERGQFQVRPIWQRDCRRLFGVYPDPYDLDELRRIIPRWLAHYAPRVGAETVDDLAEMYRRGPTGFRRWKAGRRAAEIAEERRHEAVQ